MNPENPEAPGSRQKVIEALRRAHRTLCYAREIHFSPNAWAPGPINSETEPPPPWRGADGTHPVVGALEAALEAVGERRSDGVIRRRSATDGAPSGSAGEPCLHANRKDKGSFDKCLDCGERFVPENVSVVYYKGRRRVRIPADEFFRG